MTHGASINVPEFDGSPRECGDVWRLHKGTHAAICNLWTHPLGAEVRIILNGEMLRTEAGATE